MKKILLFLLSFLYSLYCVAQLEVSPAFDDEKKILYLTFKNTTEYTIMIKQGTPLTSGSIISYLEIFFLDGDNKVIARRESAFSWDNVFLIESNEQKKTQYHLNRYGYRNIKKIKIEYIVRYSTLEKNKNYRMSNSAVFEWGN